jgi:hypothetical protein
MCDPVTIAITATAVAGGMQAYGQYQEGSATNKYMQRVAETQEEQGRIELARGQKQSELIQDSAKFTGTKQSTDAARVESAQRAALVAKGIDLSSVTAQDLASETMSKSKLDELAIRYNADINSWNVMQDAKYKKWGLDTEAMYSRLTGKNAKKSGQRQAFTTLLGTAASMAMMGAMAPGKVPGGGGTSPLSGGGGGTTYSGPGGMGQQFKLLS